MSIIITLDKNTTKYPPENCFLNVSGNIIKLQMLSGEINKKVPLLIGFENSFGVYVNNEPHKVIDSNSLVNEPIELMPATSITFRIVPLDNIESEYKIEVFNVILIAPSPPATIAKQ